MVRSLLLPCALPVMLALSGCTSADAGPDRPPHLIEQGAFGTIVHTPEEAGGWSLVWSDEFDGDRIDTDKWVYDVDCWGGGNGERQCYTVSESNSAIRDGKLVITARQEESSGAALPLYARKTKEEREAVKTQSHTSARLTTRGKESWQYGWVELRAKLPQGQGSWPALWMMPDDNSYGTWAASGEIDIVEAVNLGIPCKTCPGGIENTIFGALHFGGVWPDNEFVSTEVPMPGDLDGFHTYSVIWSEGQIMWLVDGRVYAVKQGADWSSSGSSDVNAPFDRPFHLVMNLAIGGALPEGRGQGGVSSADFPRELEVDWVRVWQCDADIAKDTACAIDGGK